MKKHMLTVCRLLAWCLLPLLAMACADSVKNDASASFLFPATSLRNVTASEINGGGDFLFTVSLNGDYTDSQTLTLTEKDFSANTADTHVLIFDTIPIGARVYATATVEMVTDESDAEPRILYIGTSNQVEIKAGKNDISLTLTKCDETQDSDTPTEVPEEPEPNPDPETPEEPEPNPDPAATTDGDITLDGITILVADDADISVIKSIFPASESTRSRIVTFTAAPNCTTYTWKLDGTIVDLDASGRYTVADTTLSDDGSALLLNIYTWTKGTYDLTLLATDSDGNYYSYAAQIIKTE